MKTNPSHKNNNRGSVLMVTMCILAVGLISLACYLMVVQAENNNVSRSQAWNAIISVSEAGVEDGLALVNQGFPAPMPNPLGWTNSTPNWNISSNGQVFSRTQQVYGSNSYSVTVDISSGKPTIISVGTVSFTPMPWAFSANRGPLFAAAGMPFLAAGTTSGNTNSTTTTTSATLGRKVQVQTVLSTLFTAAIVAKSNITFNGNGTLIDSFDSSNPLYNTGGQYDVSKRKANGSAGTDSAISSAFNLGNGNIYGKAMTGPGTQQSAVNVGPNGAVGDASWNASQKGIESGYWSGDLNLNVPDVPVPANSATLPAASNGVITVTSGSYLAASAPGPIYVNGPVSLWVTTSYTPNITFNTNNPNASLVLYVGAATGSGVTLSLGGNGNLNYPGYARNLQIYGLPSCTSIDFHGNATICGTIYAPEAAVTGGGGGANNEDLSGAIIASSITAKGHWNTHYDESLSTNGPSRGWIPKNWSELKYP